MRTSTAVTLLSLALLGVAVLCEAASEPVVTVTPSKITVTGVNPNAKILFFGAGFEPKNYQAVVHRWSSVVTNTDPHGTVSYDLVPAVTWNAL